MRVIRLVRLAVPFAAVAAVAGCGADPPPPKPVPPPAPVVAAPVFPAEHKAAFDADVAEAKKQAEAGFAVRQQADSTLRSSGRAAARPLYQKALGHFQAARGRLVAWAEDPRKTASFTPQQKEHYIKPVADDNDRYVTQIAQIGNELTMK